MTKTFQLGLLFLGALALSFTLATAEGKCGEGKCGDSKKEMKDSTSRCGNATKETGKMKCAAGKCGSDMKEKAPKKAPSKGKCGQGKCS